MHRLGAIAAEGHNRNEAGLVALWPSARHLAQVRNGSLADIGEGFRDVRFTPKADMHQRE